MDVHVLTQIEGRLYLCNLFGWKGATDEMTGESIGVHYPGGFTDVVKAMTNQGTEFLLALESAWGDQLSKQQIAEIGRQWNVLDADIKGFMNEVDEGRVGKVEGAFQVEFLIWQLWAMLHAQATLGRVTDAMVLLYGKSYQELSEACTYLLQAKEEDCKSLLEHYGEKAKTRYLKQPFETTTAALSELARLAWFVWVLKRRLGLV
jgi:hypothetical protein